MSFKAMTWASQLRLGHQGTKMVLMMMAGRANENEQFWASQSWLSRAAECSERAVRSALVKLEKTGVISRCEQVDSFTLNGVRQESFIPQTVVYRINVDAVLFGLPDARSEASANGTTCREGRHDVPGGAAPHAAYTVTDSVKKEEGDLTTFGLLGGASENLSPEMAHQRRQEFLADEHGVLIGEDVKIPDGLPAVEMVVVYNAMLAKHGLPTCLMLSKTRVRNLAGRFKDCNRSLDTWKEVMRNKIAASQFLMGHSQARPGQEPFRASLDWIIGPGNFVKIVEGNYVRQGTDYNGVQ